MLTKGTAVMEVEGEIKRKLQKGSHFGKLCLFYDTCYSYDAKCTSKCEFLAISRIDFEKVLSTYWIRQKYAIYEYLRKIDFFQVFNQQKLENLSQNFRLAFFEKGDIFKT